MKVLILVLVLKLSYQKFNAGKERFNAGKQSNNASTSIKKHRDGSGVSFVHALKKRFKDKTQYPRCLAH